MNFDHVGLEGLVFSVAYSLLALTLLSATSSSQPASLDPEANGGFLLESMRDKGGFC